MASNNNDPIPEQVGTQFQTLLVGSHHEISLTTYLTGKQNSDEARPDVTAAVDELLNTISNKFANVSSEIFAKMDEMSRRIDKLEAELVESKAKEGSQPKS
ncbi:hypothetical protein ACO1O0_009076 [Amphichorda felina]